MQNDQRDKDSQARRSAPTSDMHRQAQEQEQAQANPNDDAQVRITRDKAPLGGGPTSKTVAESEVASYEAQGWHRA